MPNQRDPNKVVTSIGMHKDILGALRAAAKAGGTDVTHYILETVAARMGFALGEKDYPLGLGPAKPRRRKK